jgi:methyl-accepting chemotaxis protein
MNQPLRHALAGAAFGTVFPLAGGIVLAASGSAGLGGEGFRAAAASPAFWVFCTIPFFLAVFALVGGTRQAQAAANEVARRDGFLKTASELFTAAQSLLSTVSSFSSMTAETAASVRETTATMGQLAQTATRAALTAETVIGLARQGERASREGLATVDTSLSEMAKLADEVRALSNRIENLNVRMRDVFAVASAVNLVAERSGRLSERASAVAAGGRGGAELAAELAVHAEDTRRAAAEVKGILADVHRAMLSAMTAAEVGIRRAEHGAEVAAGTGETIRRLATALQESSQAAREIATVAQQQDHGVDQVLKAMNEIYLATQETMSSTQAVATEAKALNDLASGLKRAVEG